MEAAVQASAVASKRVVFVGGLADGANVSLLRAAMIPFGPIASVDMPMDYVEGKHRGFGFVEYEDAEDAEEAVFNMDGGELLGRTLKVSLAQANQLHKLTDSKSKAIWKSDEWFQKNVAGTDDEDIQRRKNQQDAKALVGL